MKFDVEKIKKRIEWLGQEMLDLQNQMNKLGESPEDYNFWMTLHSQEKYAKMYFDFCINMLRFIEEYEWIF